MLAKEKRPKEKLVSQLFGLTILLTTSTEGQGEGAEPETPKGETGETLEGEGTAGEGAEEPAASEGESVPGETILEASTFPHSGKSSAHC
jgi:hypothetical protein